MSTRVETTHACDRCGVDVQRSGNSEVRISKDEGHVWSRFHIVINLRTGVNNDASTRQSDLCQNCSSSLLKMAAYGVINGLDKNLSPRIL